MAPYSIDEKPTSSPDVYTTATTPSSNNDADYTYASPLSSWMYRSRKIGPLILPYYASPKAQLLLVSFVCFLCPGVSITHVL